MSRRELAADVQAVQEAAVGTYDQNLAEMAGQVDGNVIRATAPADVPEVVDLVIAAELFSAQDISIVEDLFSRYFTGAQREGHASIVDDDLGLRGVAYYKPREAADRVWELTMIAVRPDQQGHGRGSRLLQHIETVLRDAGQRLLLVETSGTAAYDRARAFYRQHDYDQEARIRGYWTDEDDMVLLRKDLRVKPGEL